MEAEGRRQVEDDPAPRQGQTSGGQLGVGPGGALVEVAGACGEGQGSEPVPVHPHGAGRFLQLGGFAQPVREVAVLVVVVGVVSVREHFSAGSGVFAEDRVPAVLQSGEQGGLPRSGHALDHRGRAR
jgi:hypothetical protein